MCNRDRSEELRLAVVGAGAIGEHHARSIHAHDMFSLVGICDVDPNRRTLADDLGVPFYGCAEALIDAQRPSGAVVATPNAHHASVAEICARRSVHLLIEKPIAETLEQAQRIVATADRYAIRVLVGHHRRHSPRVRQARRLVRSGAIGRLVGVSILWALLKPQEYFDVAWRRERPGGGPLLINLIHELDTLRFICGEITEVYARMHSAVRGLPVEDSLSMSLCFENGALGAIMASDATPAAWSYEATTGENPAFFPTGENCCFFLGTSGSLAFPNMELWRYADGAPRGWRHPMERLHVDVDAFDPLRAQLEHFGRIIRDGEEPVANAREGAKTLAVAVAAQESHRLGRPVHPHMA